MLFNEKLIRRRKECGMTQEELADRLSVSRQTVSKWENGDCMPDADKFIRLSDILEISLDELAGREVEVEPIVLPAPEVPKPGKKLRRILAAAAACLLIGLGCFFLGRYAFPKAAPTENGQTAPLPAELTVRGFDLHIARDNMAEEVDVVCSFVSNVTADGTVFLYPQDHWRSPVAVAAHYENGVYTSKFLQHGTYARAVFVVSADGEERSVLLAEDLEILESGWSFKPAE